MKRDYRLFIEDIMDCIEKIEQFVGDLSFDEFVKDDKTSSAVVRKLEIIGEATKNIPMYIRGKYEDLPWNDMAKMRDKIIWNVIKERLPEIKLTICQILKEIKNG